MKKTTIILSTIALSMLLISCSKDQIGIYTPAKKIDQILEKTGTTTRPYESWFWSGNLLSKIEHYSNGSTLLYTKEYQYENGRIAGVTAKNEKTEYVYEDGELAKVNYYLNSLLEESYEITYKNKKPSKITFKFERGRQKVAERLLSPIGRLCGDEVAERLITSNGAKGETSEPDGQILLKWVGDNLARVDILTYSQAQYSGDATITYNFEYDDKKNPFSGLLAVDFEKTLTGDFITGCISSNNVTCIYKTVFNDVLGKYITDSWTYEYEYDKKFPVSVVEKHHHASGNSSTTASYIIKY